MSIWRLQVAYQLDTAFPRDKMVITPHFRTDSTILPADVDALCEDLASACQANGMGTGELTLKGNDAQGSVPVVPQATAIRNAGVVDTSSGPREVALCLSFFSGQNVPRKRGRLYFSMSFLNSAASTLRPSSGQITGVANFATVFQELGGTDIDWCIDSRADDAAYPVTNWYVDDEWDIVRSRGLRATSRTSGTTSE